MRENHCLRSLGIAVAACCFLLIASLLGTRTNAQLAGATLSGVVSDASGSAVASAKVSIKNLATSDIRELTTNADGLYSAPNLLPGNLWA
ncbi:MAG: hypothetical protein DMG40_13325 [Acidobacteria bacterium]|nr:MAG: hypothetical protein DMG40_13325 [Acidobacteriota bacterium]